jgi:internalin A
MCRAETPDTAADAAAALPVEFGFLGQLRTLDISNNAISSIPAGCFVKWSRLERLLVNDNRLTALSADVSSLSALKELDLHNNRLRALTAEIANLKQLTKLNLEGNWIAELPAQLSTMQLHSLEVGPQHCCIR